MTSLKNLDGEGSSLGACVALNSNAPNISANEELEIRGVQEDLVTEGSEAAGMEANSPC